MINGLQEGLAGLREDISGFITEQPLKSAAVGLGGAGLITGAVLGGGAIIKAVKKKRKKTKKKVRKRARPVRKARRRKAGSYRKKRLTVRQRYVRRIKKRKGRQSPYTAGARRDRSTRRIRHTKNGQPYIILRSGKARFIKKSSARRSRKLKGGRY